jgi:cellulose synthase/poly-beta-1,6-N-acetylglucosamine synthase-like glycosyltransferase
MLLQALGILLLAPALLACLYYVVLALHGVAIRRPRSPHPFGSARRFAVVIPAHNEEATIAGVLRSCAELDYPADRLRVHVVADNCTDGRAAIVRAHGFDCLERRDAERRGKGWALEWALERILPEGPDAVVVLDADCTLDRHALREFDRQLLAGHRVLQACNVASNPDATVTSYVACVANYVENHLYYAPKSQLGLAVLLRGTGMVFAREVLERHPWNARSVVEDAEYSVRLYRAGLGVQFVSGACVRSHFAARPQQLAVQRKRWVGGGASFGRAHALHLIGEGLRTGRGTLIDLGWTLLVSVRSVVLLEMLLTLVVAGLCSWLVPGPLSTTLLVLAAGLPLLHGLVLALGVVLLGLSGRRLALLAGSPVVAARMLWIALTGLWAGHLTQWEKTPR